MIRQFDVVANPSSLSRPIAPYLLIVQSHLYDDGPTLLVAPMLRMPTEARLTKVSLQIDFKADRFILMLSEIGAIERRSASRSLGSLLAYEDDIRRALDRLFTGF